MNLVFLSFLFGDAKFGFATTSSLSPPACSVFRNLSFIPSRCCFDRKFRREHARGELFVHDRYKTLFVVRMLSSTFVSFFLLRHPAYTGLPLLASSFSTDSRTELLHIRFFSSRNPNMIWVRRFHPYAPTLRRDFWRHFIPTNHHPIQRIHHRRFQNRVSRDLDFVRCVWSFDFSFANGKVAESKNKQKEHD